MCFRFCGRDEGPCGALLLGGEDKSRPGSSCPARPLRGEGLLVSTRPLGPTWGMMRGHVCSCVCTAVGHLLQDDPILVTLRE